MTASHPSGLKSALKELRREQKRGKRVVFTNGCFDLIHAGHVRLLQQAKNLGDLLVVGINSDASVRLLKGKGRPILPLRDRLEILCSLKSVDYVFPFGSATPLPLIRKVNPDILVKGGDWQTKTMVGRDWVQKMGGKVVSGLYLKGRSTSSLIRKIRGGCAR